MKLLFTIDTKDYDPNGTSAIRPSVRGIIIRENTLAMIHSLKYDYYKFPGGGIENGEDHLTTLIREVAEESGLSVIPSSVQPYGYVHRVQKGTKEDMFIQDNYYYFCDVQDKVNLPQLDDYEDEECFTLEWVRPETVLYTNRNHSHGAKEQFFQFATMSERECRVIEMLIQEKRFGDEFHGLEKE